MSSVQSLFKVHFEGFNKEYDKNLHLTFISIQDLNLSYSGFPNFLRKYNELTRKKRSHTLSSINKVIPYGGAQDKNITQFYVILFTMKKKEDNVRCGYLIGKTKDNKFPIIGFWPFDREKLIREMPSIVKKEIEQIVEIPDTNAEIVLVH